MNHELPDVQARFRRCREPEIKLPNICWIIEKARHFQENVYFCFIDYSKAFDCVDHNKLWKILQEMGIPDHLICLLRNMYARQEATARIGHGTTDWFKMEKGVHQGCILSSCLFNLHSQYIMWNAGLLWLTSWNQDCWEKYQQLQICRWYHPNGRKWRGIKKLLKVKEESEKAGLKLNNQKTNIMESGSITSWQIERGIMEIVENFILGGS